MSTRYGILQYTEEETAGSRLEVTTAIGDTTVAVDWVVDFGEEGSFVLGGIEYEYVSVDGDANTIQLAEGVTIQAVVAAGEALHVQTAVAEESSEWNAYVMLPGADQPQPAKIPYGLRRYYPLGDSQAGALVPINDDYWVTDAPGRAAEELDLGIPLGAVARIRGQQVLNDGITAPGTAPRVSGTWEDLSTYETRQKLFGGAPVDPDFGTQRGLFWDSTDSVYVSTTSLGGGQLTKIQPDGDTFDSFATPAGFNPVGGAVRIGSFYYLLGFDSNRSSNWYVYKYNLTGTKQLEWRWIVSGVTGVKFPALILNGANLMICFWAISGPNNRLFGTTFQPDGDGSGNQVQVGGSVVCDDNTTTRFDLTGAYYGSADFGSTHIIAIGETNIRVYSVVANVGTRQPTKEWIRPLGDQMRGLAWDGTRFHLLGGSSARLWHLGRTTTATTRTITSTLYDNDVIGGTHETTPSPPKVHIQRAREWIEVDVDPPLYAGDPDEPNRVRHYIDNQLQADLGEGVTAAVYDLPAVGAAAPTTNGFAGVSAPGELVSSASDILGLIVELLGSGSPGRVGPLRWGADGLRLEPVIKVGGGSHTTPAGAGAFRTPTGLAETTFVAPASGAVELILNAYVGAAVAGNLIGFAPEVREGAVIRSGTVVYAANVNDMVGNRNTQLIRMPGVSVVTGLTPGATYNAYFAVYSDAANGLVNNTRLTVKPML